MISSSRSVRSSICKIDKKRLKLHRPLRVRGSPTQQRPNQLIKGERERDLSSKESIIDSAHRMKEIMYHMPYIQAYSTLSY
jgi:hypothetical protein